MCCHLHGTRARTHHYRFVASDLEFACEKTYALFRQHLQGSFVRLFDEWLARSVIDSGKLDADHSLISSSANNTAAKQI